MRKPDLGNAFTKGHELQTDEGPAILHLQELGNLDLPTGRIVACDPFVFPETKPFPVAVPPRQYRVIVSIAHLPKDYQRVAYAMIALSDLPAARWEMALRPGQDISTLGPDQFFGYPVDAGTGCFMDASVASVVARRMFKDNDWGDDLIAEMEKTRVPSWDWLNSPIETTGGNLVAFSSGWGDGACPCYWGYDADENVVSLVTDFCL